MPDYGISFTPQGATEPQQYSIYSRDENLSQEQAEKYVQQYLANPRQPMVQSENGPVLVTSPSQQQAARLMPAPGNIELRRWYDENVGAPVSNAVQSFTQNPIVQQGVGAGLSSYGESPIPMKGLDSPSQQQAAGQGFLQPVEKGITGITDDPAMLATVLGAAVLPLAGGSLINPIQKVLPSLMQRVAQMIVPGVVQGGLYATADMAMNPNATATSSIDAGVKIALVASGMNIISLAFGKFFNGRLDAQLADSITANLERTFESQGTRIATNPRQWLKEVGNVLEDSAQQKLTTTTQRLSDYIKVQSENNPQVLKDFTTSMSGLQQGIQDLARGDSTAHTRIIANLDKTMQIVQGVGSTASPMTQPSDTVMAYLFSKDPQFLKVLANSGVKFKSADLAQELATIDKSGIPLWKQYASAGDTQRIVNSYASQQQGMASQRNVLQQQQLGLQAWKQTVGKQALEMLELEKARQITEAVLKPGIVSGVEMQRSALDIAKKYASTEAQVHSAIEAVYGAGGSNIQKLQYVNPADLKYGIVGKQFPALHGLAEWRANTSLQPTGLSRVLPGSSGAINVEVARELQKMNE